MSLCIPIVIMGYESILLGKESVVFLADYPTYVGTVIIIYYLLLIVAGLIWGGYQFKQLWTLKNEKSKNELLHLQSQVNPHFFFNMLNNIYGTVDSDPATTKKMILKLSDLMRYGIYEGEKDKVPLAEELAYLKNYIELHQMRYYKKIAVQWEEEINNSDVSITPLLFIILVENAFKHGVEKLREKAYISINVKVNSTSIVFKIENNVDADEKSNNEGIGLKNLKRRLALLYPNKHQLTLSHEPLNYTAVLTIAL